MKENRRYLLVFVFMMIMGLVAAGCGSSDDSSPTASVTDPGTAQGRFVDSPVEGVEYTSGSQNGITGPNGEFTYEIGKKVKFSIGAIQLGESEGKEIVTPLDLVSDGETSNDAVVNMARLLQSLDSDLTDEKITIPRKVREQSVKKELEALCNALDFSHKDSFDNVAGKVISQLVAKGDDYKHVVNLLDESAAVDHMKVSLEKVGISFNYHGPAASPSANSLNRFAHADKLAAYLKKGLDKTVRGDGLYQPPVPMSGEADMGTTESGGNNVSKTNIQESGVDEADTIKTDGEYLYIAPGADYPVYGIPEPMILADGTEEPKPEVIKDEMPAPEERNPQIRVLRLSETPPAATEVARISVKKHEKAIDGLYLLNDRGEGKPDLLVTVGGRMGNLWLNWCNPWFWTAGATEIALFDVTDPAAPVSLKLIKLDGQLISTRRIENKIYVVTRYTPSIPHYEPYNGDEEIIEENQKRLEEASLTQLLPNLTVDGEVVGNLIRPDQCFLPPMDEEREAQPNLITVTAIDLDSPDNPVSKSIAGPTETMYVSTKSLYLATTRFDYSNWFRGGVLLEDARDDVLVATNDAEDDDNPPDIAPPLDNLIPPEPPEVTTELHKFSLGNAGPEYICSGTVDGSLGWEEDKKPFRMSEYQDVLRIATSIGDEWSGTASTLLTLLKENDGKTELVETAHIDNIGETGEKLYAARFMGKLGYLVTFRTTDPLYIFDLSDPNNPAQVGELHIDGYSDYLHPVGDNMLLGIGKDAIPDDTATDFMGRGAWYQGVKLSLFDVSDPSNPTEVQSMVFGKRGTESDALWDHHALAYLPPTSTAPARLALPIKLHNTEPPPSDWFNPEEPWAYYDWTHTGLYLFEIETGEREGFPAGLAKKGEMVVDKRDDTSDHNYYWSITSDRAVLLGDSVHYINNTNVWSATWGAGDDMTGPR